MNKPTSPHDAITKTFLSDLAVAEDFLRSHLPATVKKHVDFNTLQLEPTSFVDKNLKHYTTDILYSINIDDAPGFIYCLVEAQSTPDKLMPFRFWSYQSLILNHYLKNNQDQETKLPVIIPLLLYTGKQSPYPYSLELTDCFENKSLAKMTLYEPAHLIDLSQISDDEINQHGQAALLEMVQKHIRDRDFIAFAYKLSSLLNKMKITQSLYIQLLQYIIIAGDSTKFEGFFKVLTEQSIEYRSDTMNIAQRLENKGREAGLQQGAYEEKFEIARNLLAMGMNDELVVQATKLSMLEIKNLH